MFGNRSKGGSTKALVLSPEAKISVINVDVDPPYLTASDKKSSHKGAWIINGPLRKLESVGNYVLLRSDRLSPLAPDKAQTNSVSPALLGQAISKRYAEVTATPVNKSLGSILMFDMILLGLGCIFGLATVVMLMPQVMGFLKFGGVEGVE
tara:strand:- start:10071 stop:10523 length:453 start_codon:yes stop_codon:yes gene_type:complete